MKTSTLKTSSQVNETISSNKEMFYKKRSVHGESSKIYYPMIDSHIDTIIRENEIKLFWYNLPDEDQKYEIYRNGKYLTTVKGNEYLDTNLPQSNEYKYSVISYKKIPQNEIKEKMAFLEQKKIKVTKENKKALLYERKELGTIVIASEKNAIENKSIDDKVKTLAPPVYPNGYGYLVRYTTFIPLDRAPNPWCEDVGICTYDEFGGDTAERGFDMWSNKFRTRADAYITWDWDNEPNSIVFDPQTGVTTGYKNGVEVGRDKAPAEEDMKIKSEETGSDWIYHRMFLASSNPLVLSPDIDAFYYAKLYNSSYSAEFYGVHDQAPSHELYLMDYPGSFGIDIHTQEHQGFDYLWPWTTKTEFNVSF